MRFIGIDPGASGGIAILGADGAILEVHKMPDTERGILDVLRPHGGIDASGNPKARGVLELIHAMPHSKMGTIGASKLGKSHGALRMAFTAAEIPFEEAVPTKWMRSLGCLTGGDKNVTKKKAQDLFPGIKVTHHIADCLLIAEYARRLETRQ